MQRESFDRCDILSIFALQQQSALFHFFSLASMNAVIFKFHNAQHRFFFTAQNSIPIHNNNETIFVCSIMFLRSVCACQTEFNFHVLATHYWNCFQFPVKAKCFRKIPIPLKFLANSAFVLFIPIFLFFFNTDPLCTWIPTINLFD